MVFDPYVSPALLPSFEGLAQEEIMVVSGGAEVGGGLWGLRAVGRQRASGLSFMRWAQAQEEITEVSGGAEVGGALRALGAVPCGPLAVRDNMATGLASFGGQEFTGLLSSLTLDS